MMLDAQTMFDPGVTPLAGVATTQIASPNVIDLQTARDLGLGEKDLFIIVCVVAALVGANSTVKVDVQTSPDNVTWTTTQTLGTFAALSAIGKQLKKRVQVGDWNDRYVRLNYTIGTATLTSAQLKAALVPDLDAFNAYKNNTQITG